MIAVFFVMALMFVLAVRLVDSFDVAHRVLVEFRPYASSVPCIVLALCVMILLCHPRISNLLDRINKVKVGGVEIETSPHIEFDDKTCERLLALMQTAISFELQKTRISGVFPTKASDGTANLNLLFISEGREESEDAKNPGTANLVQKWAWEDERELEIMKMHASRIGARLTARNLRLKGERSEYDGVLEKDGDTILLEVKRGKMQGTTLRSLEMQVKSFESYRQRLSKEESAKLSYHLLVDCTGESELAESSKTRIDSILRQSDNARLFIYSSDIANT